MSQNILITGGTGLVGSRLTELLLAAGHRVSILSRRRENIAGATVYLWDVARQTIEPGAVEQADAIIHLAGAGVADSRWTPARKREILHSRTESARLLHDTLVRTGHRPGVFVSASGVGLYGDDRGDELLPETAAPGGTFLADVVRAWEASVAPVAALGVRTVLLRIGVVLSGKGGALPKIAAPVRLGAGAALGTGRQWMSWIHIDDLCRLFIHALENEAMHGPYNAVGPHPATNAQLTRAIAGVLGKPLLLPNVPAFALRLGVGQLASVVLGGLRVDHRKVAATGFEYRFPDLEPALRDLL